MATIREQLGLPEEEEPVTPPLSQNQINAIEIAKKRAAAGQVSSPLDTGIPGSNNQVTASVVTPPPPPAIAPNPNEPETRDFIDNPPPSNQERPSYQGPLMANAVSTTTQRDLGQPLLKGEIDELGDLRKTGITANEELVKLQQREAELGSRELLHRQGELGILEQERKHNEEKRRIDISQKEQEINAVIGEYRNMKVDPEAYLDKSTFGRIGAAIAVGLGTYGSIKTGAPNYALQIIEGAIQRDIDAQKANIAKKGNEISDKRGIYSDMLNRFKDERVAELATKAAYLEQSAARIETLAAQSKSPQIAAAYKAQQATLNEKGQIVRIELLSKILPSTKISSTVETKPVAGKEPTKLDEQVLKGLNNKDGAIQQYVDAATSLKNFDAMTKNPNLQASATTQFIADTLKQGSVTAQQLETIFSMKWTDKWKETFQTAYKGGISPVKLQALREYVDAYAKNKLPLAAAEADAYQTIIGSSMTASDGSRMTVGKFKGVPALDVGMKARIKTKSFDKEGSK